MMKSLPSAARLAEAALEFVRDGCVVGLGSGRAATAFVRALAERVKTGLRVRCVATSLSTEKLAVELGIPLADPDRIEAVDVTVDGADEVSPARDLIKGLGGALVREKIVASFSHQLVILVGSEKMVSVLGEHGILPVEVVPFGLAWCRRRLTQLGYPPTQRQAEGQPFVSDNGNYLLDCRVPPLRNPSEVEQMLWSIPGVVGTGLFLGMAPTVLVDDGHRIERLDGPSA